MEPTPKKSNIAVISIIIVLVIIVLAGLFLWRGIGQENVIGGDKDANGCLVGAGYSWCQARQECERSWERYCTGAAPKTAVFTCAGGKTISAKFYPTDDKYVDLVLSDDRSLSVPRALSASGARYAKADESFVFWNKGDTAFVTENGTTTFEGCVTQK